MTLHRQLLTSNNNIIDIVTEDAQAEEHFSNRANFADIVLNQINTDRFYDPIFDGEEDLTILDIGGNIGLFSLYVHDKAKTVYTIEPTPGHFHILEELTKDYNNIQPINVAVHNTDTTIDFYISEENSTMNSSVNKYGTKVEVQARTLATLIKELELDHVDFVKCDIEGSEMVALTDETVGAVKDIVDSWFVEVHATDDENLQGIDSLRANRQKLVEIFERQGYATQQLREDSLYIFKDEQIS
jgi:FkbM family methyltransferase